MARETGVLLGEATLDVVIGFVLVLTVMILLIAIFWAFGKVMSTLNNNKKEAAAAPAAVPQPVPAVKPAVGAAAEDEEIVAVIAAAVAAMAPEGKTYAVRRIRCQSSGRPVWAAAGAFENTRPF